VTQPKYGRASGLQSGQQVAGNVFGSDVSFDQDGQNPVLVYGLLQALQEQGAGGKGEDLSDLGRSSKKAVQIHKIRNRPYGEDEADRQEHEFWIESIANYGRQDPRGPQEIHDGILNSPADGDEYQANQYHPYHPHGINACWKIDRKQPDEAP